MTPAESALEAIYAELSSLFANATCPRSTRCCRFVKTGRVPYVWPVEAERVLKAIARRGGRLPRGGEPGDCPLLKSDGFCSIYEDRPLICREYVVVSPPERCSDPRWQGVQVLRLPLEVWRAYGRTAEPRSDGRLRFVPLTLAPQWVEAHQDEPAGQSGPELLQTLLGELTGRRVAPSSDRPGEGNSDGV